MSPSDAPPIRLLDGDWYVQDPHRGFAWMRAHAPVHWDGEVWGVAGYEKLMRVSKDTETFCSSQSSRPDSPPMDARTAEA